MTKAKIQNLDISTLEAEFIGLPKGIKTAKLRAGEILVRLSEITGHGTGWDNQLKSLCDRAEISRATAYNYMKAYRVGRGDPPTKTTEPDPRAIVRRVLKTLNKQQTKDALTVVLKGWKKSDSRYQQLAEDIADTAAYLTHIVYDCEDCAPFDAGVQA